MAAEQEKAPQQATPAERTKYVIYGRNHAVQLEADMARRSQLATLLVDAAPMVERRPQWNRKTQFQFTDSELPAFAAAVLRRRPVFEASAHGPSRDKGLRYGNEPGYAILTVQAPGIQHAVRVRQTDAYWISLLAVDALRQAKPGLDSQTVLSLLLRTHFESPDE